MMALQTPHDTADHFDERTWMRLIAGGATLTALVLALVLGWKLLYEQAYLVPPGGPGLAKPGVLDDATAKDMARRWFMAKWSFRPETFAEMKEEILANVHPGYRNEVKAELEQDGRVVQQFKVSAQLLCDRQETKILKRKEQTLMVALHCLRTFAWSGQEQLPEYIDAKIVVTLLSEHGRLSDVVVAKSTATPGFSITGLGKGK